MCKFSQILYIHCPIAVPPCNHVVPSSDSDLVDFFLHASLRSSFEVENYWDQSQNEKTNLFAHILLKKYAGPDERLNVSELDILISNVRKVIVNDSKIIQEAVSIVNSSVCESTDKLCIIHKNCINAEDIFIVHNFDKEESLNVTNFVNILPTLVYALQQSDCEGYMNNTTEGRPKHKPPVEQVWGFGFVCVTLINLCSLLGMVFIPLAKQYFYKKLLMFMVALGVGTLTGSSLLFLIPECFGLTHEHSPYKDEYIWKATVVLCGVYLFFLTERILQSIMDKRDEIAIHKDHVGSIKLASRTRHDSTTMNMTFEVPESATDKKSQSKLHLSHIDTNESQISTGDKSSDSEANTLVLPHVPTSQSQVSGQSQQPLLDSNSRQIQLGINDNEVFTLTKEKSKGNGHCHNVNLEGNKKQVIKSVAWMIIFGDGLHNFIDGLSIGAAFSENILAGISVSLAVICEELPHELGDFAILLNSGMRVKQALLYNFLSACMCYFGLILGILIGEFTNGASWIFAIAGGMFLYISLVDMLPEVNHAAQQEIKETGKSTRVFIIQNLGLLTGYGLMLVLAMFTGEIDLQD